MKLGVCIPYRDSGDGVRQGHLDRLIPHLEEFLGKQINENSMKCLTQQILVFG